MPDDKDEEKIWCIIWDILVVGLHNNEHYTIPYSELTSEVNNILQKKHEPRRISKQFTISCLKGIENCCWGQENSKSIHFYPFLYALVVRKNCELPGNGMKIPEGKSRQECMVDVWKNKECFKVGNYPF